jgi:GH15 family glucan-1,4-alpha-glucosidase
MTAKALRAAADELLASVMEARFPGIAMASVYMDEVRHKANYSENGIIISINSNYYCNFPILWRIFQKNETSNFVYKPIRGCRKVLIQNNDRRRQA